MKNERKKDVKTLIRRFDKETMFMSSTHMMYENRHFKKLENLAITTNNKKRLFKLVRSQLKNNIFLFKILEDISTQPTILKPQDMGRMNKIYEFWRNYQY